MTKSSLSDFKYYLFDFDGTLFDSFDLIVATSNACACKYRPDLFTENNLPDRAFVETLIGRSLRDMLQQILQKEITDEFYEEAYKFFRTYQQSMFHKHAKLFPNVMDTIRGLKTKGHKVAIVTSRTRPTLLPYTEHFGIRQIVDAIVSPEDVEAHKPDPAPVRKAMGLLGAVDPAEVVMIGDTEFDIEAGHNAGVSSCLVGWSATPLERLPRPPTFIAKTMSDFIGT
ncbi:HAD hydrolase, subfamily IA [Carpediemonas membranifera]|uniref:HAD hydrolase, subfamily IA n=1 Tax=Carpediemonas membranifera TaxID=201153 RepID=A0A8J6AYY9_9EUKA|nr:HAD hydrolase, subfamily IA [Carpediemonas membranifera]|eukprot:KAG9397468.1 HAD hydrolase, subfamily IA [Carpediemonas membranifera]